MATRLLALGMHITDIQKFLGHEDIGATRIYAETSVACSGASSTRSPILPAATCSAPSGPGTATWSAPSRRIS